MRDSRHTTTTTKATPIPDYDNDNSDDDADNDCEGCCKVRLKCEQSEREIEGTSQNCVDCLARAHELN